jgi:hypoxanthine phosphoribosyltransferase
MSTRKQDPYDYATREGALALSWQDVENLTHRIVEQLAARGVETVVGIARAGLLPATAVAAALDCDLTPVRVTRRKDRQVVRAAPEWKVDVSPDVAGQVVAVIDEMASTGETIALVAGRVLERGATRVVTASLAAHTWANPMPDVVGLVSDALVIFPWDRLNYIDGAWVCNPEIVEALKVLRVEIDLNKPFA